MRRILGLLIALLLAATCLLIWLHKTITIVVDDQPQRVTGFALTVGGALQTAGIPLGAADLLQPPVDTWLSESLTITLEHAAAVQIAADGKLINFISPARTPSDLLAAGGVALHAGDVLLFNGAPISLADPLPQAGAYSLQVLRSTTIHLQISGGSLDGVNLDGDSLDGVSRPITTTASTLGQALWDVGIRLHVADLLTPSFDSPLTPGLSARLLASRPITIQTADGNFTRRSAAATVGEALAEAGLAPQGLDYTLPAADAVLPADGSIRLVRVREEVLIEQTSLPYASDWQPVDDLELDQRTLVQPGEYGIQASRVRLRYEDGVEISRTVESQWQAKAPVNEIVGYGMQIVMHTLDSPDGPVNYYRALQFWATSYAPKQLGGSSRTASGQTVRKGLVGVDLAYIPLGTLLYIPGYGFAEAADTGRISGRWIDLGYSDDDYESWHQWVTVYFLWPPGYVPPVIPPPLRY
jgi:uncharacterized protein YabE (DUF348 family)